MVSAFGAFTVSSFGQLMNEFFPIFFSRGASKEISASQLLKEPVLLPTLMAVALGRVTDVRPVALKALS